MQERNACFEEKILIHEHSIIKVHFPDLTEEERKHRMKTLHNAAENLLKKTKVIQGGSKNENIYFGIN